MCLIAKAGLELTVQMRMTLYFWSTCLHFHFPLDGIYAVLEIKPGASSLLGKLFKLSSSPSPWRLLPSLKVPTWLFKWGVSSCGFQEIRLLPFQTRLLFPSQTSKTLLKDPLVFIIQYLGEAKTRHKCVSISQEWWSLIEMWKGAKEIYDFFFASISKIPSLWR